MKISKTQSWRIKVIGQLLTNVARNGDATVNRILNSSSKRIKQDFEEGDVEDGESSSEESEDDEIQQQPKGLSINKHIANRLATRVPGEVFLQDGPCYGMGHNIVKCHVCKYTSKSEREDVLSHGKFEDADSDISCCFYAFRKLRYTKTGNVTVAGYLDPEKDVNKSKSDNSQDDFQIWRGHPSAETQPTDDALEKAKFILGLIGDQFCDMVMQEQKCSVLEQGTSEEQNGGVEESCQRCA